MLNQVVLVGRLTSDLEIKKVEEDRKVCNITLAINSSFKNANGEYDTDFVSCTLFDNIAQNTSEYCHKGDVIGLKGRVKNCNFTDDDGNIIGTGIEIIAEKITFLSSKKAD